MGALTTSRKQWPVEIDYAKPMYGQVHLLGEDYEEWCHIPSGKPSFRMFESDLMEQGSKTPWHHIPLYWCPLVFFFAIRPSLEAGCEDDLYNHNHAAPLSPPPTFAALNATDDTAGAECVPTGLTYPGLAACLVVGVCMWTLLEYGLHRFIFHARISGKTPWVITTHFLLHGQHHKFPLDRGRLVFPLVPGTGFGAAFYLLCLCLFPAKEAKAVVAGILYSYVAYDLTHYWSHFGGSQGYVRAVLFGPALPAVLRPSSPTSPRVTLERSLFVCSPARRRLALGLLQLGLLQRTETLPHESPLPGQQRWYAPGPGGLRLPVCPWFLRLSHRYRHRHTATALLAPDLNECCMVVRVSLQATGSALPVGTTCSAQASGPPTSTFARAHNRRCIQRTCALFWHALLGWQSRGWPHSDAWCYNAISSNM